jgi:hypothetical protein
VEVCTTESLAMRKLKSKKSVAAEALKINFSGIWQFGRFRKLKAIEQQGVWFLEKYFQKSG